MPKNIAKAGKKWEHFLSASCGGDADTCASVLQVMLPLTHNNLSNP